jgi:hypothetical protein
MMSTTNLDELLVPFADVGRATPCLLSGIHQFIRGRQRIGLVVIAVLEDLVECVEMMVG